jgi:hypothetical protein
MLVSEETVTAIDPLGLGRGVKCLEIVARLRITVGEYGAARRLLQHPDLGAVALAPQIGSDAGCQEMHVDAERGRRRAPRQPTLLPAKLNEGQPKPAKVPWHRCEQIFGFAEFLEIVQEEAVLPIVAGGSLCAPLQEIF